MLWFYDSHGYFRETLMVPHFSTIDAIIRYALYQNALVFSKLSYLCLARLFWLESDLIALIFLSLWWEYGVRSFSSSVVRIVCLFWLRITDPLIIGKFAEARLQLSLSFKLLMWEPRKAIDVIERSGFRVDRREEVGHLW